MKTKNNIKKVIGNSLKLAAMTATSKAINDSLSLGKDIIISKFSIHNNCEFNSPIYNNLLLFSYDVDIKIRKNISYTKSNTPYISCGIYIVKYNDNIIILKSYTDNKYGELRDMIDYYIIGKQSKELYDTIVDYKHNSTNSKDITVQTINKNGMCQYQGTIKSKSLNDIYIDNMNEIILYLDNYKSNKELYERLSITYKYGLFLYGDPGTGKTSLAKAIAKYLGYNIVYVTPPDLTKDNISALLKLQSTVILIEEIDRYTNEKGEIENLSNILNITDGIFSPSEVFFIVTTNHIDKVDDALYRKGRFDAVIEIKPIHNIELARQMCIKYEANPDEILKDMALPINQSELQSKILMSKNRSKENK